MSFRELLDDDVDAITLQVYVRDLERALSDAQMVIGTKPGSKLHAVARELFNRRLQKLRDYRDPKDDYRLVTPGWFLPGSRCN